MADQYVPCIHLDYDEERYGDACELRTAPGWPGVQFWVRKHFPDGVVATNVQFCKRQGLINEILGCYQPIGDRPCFDTGAAPEALPAMQALDREFGFDR